MDRKVTSERRLEYWRGVVERDKSAWEKERGKMDWREELFAGTHKMRPTCAAEEAKQDKLKCYHVRNVVAENIESMVDSRVPRPKVQAMREEDEGLARILEDCLVQWGKRVHLRKLNDLAERMGPIQGGLFWLVEWDDSVKTPDGPGDAKLSILHPKQVIPQAGIFTDAEDMDHICLMVPMSVMQVLQRYGVDVDRLAEDNPEARSRSGDADGAEDMVTVYQLFYRNGDGGVGLLAWAGDSLLCDRRDYQARMVRRCKSCGAVASYTQELSKERQEELRIAGQDRQTPERCIWCEGTEFEEAEDPEEIIMPPGQIIMDNQGNEIPLEPAVPWTDEHDRLRYEPRTKIAYYKPDLMPVVLQKNVSVFGQLLGESDVDKMADAQNTVKRIDKKVLDRLVKAGTMISLPNDVHIETDTDDQRVIRLSDPAKAAMIGTYEFTGELGQALNVEAKAYEEARQATGVTDSMQGRRDPTATSAKAKEYSASKSEGRMESRRVLKAEAWSRIYERVAKLYLAYADNTRRVRVEQAGKVSYESFDRKRFLKQGKKGELYYEDGFVFSVDDAASIGESREAMWQEINRSFTAGTLGDITSLDTLILYWGLMEEQSYPGASVVKAKLEEMRDQAKQAAAVTPPEAGGEVPPVGGAGAPVVQ